MQRLAFVMSVLSVFGLGLAHTAQAAASPPGDPLAAMLSKEGFAPGTVDRDASLGWVNVSLTKSTQRFDGDRIALVRSLAERAARLEGLPALDTIDLEPAVRRTDEPLARSFRRLTLRLAAPPLDGPCIDPRVEVGLYDEPLDNGAYAPPRATSLTVRCEKEPTMGNQPPADPRRVWPHAASGSLPFVALCTLGRGKGFVIDKRGDVYSYQPRLAAASTGRALSIDVRHGKQWVGALPPASLDRLVALAPLAASARYQKQPGAADAPGTECALLRAGANDTFVRVPLEENGAIAGKRLGAAAEEARRLVHRDI